MAATSLSLFNPEESPRALTAADVIALYLAHLESRVAKADFSNRFLKNGRFYLQRFGAEIPAIVNARRKTHGAPVIVSDCQQQDFVAWIDSHVTWKSSHTRKTAQAHVVTCFQWAADADRGDLIERCPFKRIPSVSKAPYTPRRAATREEINALLRHASLALRQALTFIDATGCRPIEMRELVWPWVIFDAEFPHLRLERHKTFRQTGKPKIVGLDDVMVRFLRHLDAKRKADVAAGRRSPNDLHVFHNCDGNPWTEVGFPQNLRRCASRAGLDDGVIRKVSAGCLRTTYACDLIEDGFTNRDVADLLGHTSTQMVDRVYGSETRERADRLGKLAKKANERRKNR
jgi:integrase/recombinase XerD